MGNLTTAQRESVFQNWGRLSGLDSDSDRPFVYMNEDFDFFPDVKTDEEPVEKEIIVVGKVPDKKKPSKLTPELEDSEDDAEFGELEHELSNEEHFFEDEEESADELETDEEEESLGNDEDVVPDETEEEFDIPEDDEDFFNELQGDIRDAVRSVIEKNPSFMK